MPLKMAVFDIAGTTVSDSSAVTKCLREAFREHGYDVPDQLINPLMGYKKTTAIEMVVRKMNLHVNENIIANIHGLFVSKMEVYYHESVDVVPTANAEEVMWQLKQDGLKVVLNTGFPRSIAETIVQRLGWKEAGLIDDYIASDEVENGRPDPAMIYLLMQRNGAIAANEVMKIGDTEVDIREGRNASCAVVVAVTTGTFSRAELSRYQPDHIIDDLAELTMISRSFE